MRRFYAGGRKWTLLVLVMGAIWILSGCGRRPDSAADIEQPKEKLKVVTTLFPYYDFVRQTAGELVDLTLVVPAGMDSHSFEPTPADMRLIQSADLLICNGGAMEHWLTQVLSAVDTGNMTVVTMMDYVDTYEEEIVEGMEDEAHDHDHSHSHDHSHEEDTEDGHDHSHEEDIEGGHDHSHQEDIEDGHDHGHEENTEDGHDHSHEEDTEDGHDHSHAEDLGEAHGHASDGEYGKGNGGFRDYIDHDGYENVIEYDEHIWTSPVNAMKLTKIICQVLTELDGSHADVYRQNTELYLKELAEIDDGFRQVGTDRKRNMIVVGDKFPFRYLAEEYGLDYRAAFSGCSTDTEPSAKTIAYLIDKVKTEEIPVVYYLELSSHRVSEIIGEETGAVPLLLHSCHNVTRAQFDAGITYAELMKQNVENLRKGLDE